MVKLIVAKGSNNVIGKDNTLIWHLPADMRFFSQTTKGNVVIMGRKNWESIPLKFRPLPQRENIVVTKNTEFSHPDCASFCSVEEAIQSAKNQTGKDIFIIGGGQIYNYVLANDLVDEMLVTNINAEFEGDTYFPEIDENKWAKSLVLTHDKDHNNPFGFKIWKYVRKRS